MLGIMLIISGAVVMGFGIFMLCAWVAGAGAFFNTAVFDRQGNTKNDRQFLDVYFISVVLMPLLAGATLILFGLRELLR